MRNAKQVFQFAVTREWVKSNPLKSFRCAYKHPYRETLSQEEIFSLINCEFATSDLTEARDIFIFSCYTAFAYQEAYDLTPDCIITGMDKKKWAVIVRQKTGEKEMVPLLPPALAIIEKYKNDARCIANDKLLPVRSNQEYNRVLKRVAKIAGIKKHLNTHIARHTFATTITMENDVPIETISKIMGHTSIRTTQIYTKVSLKKLSNNMNELSAKLFPASNNKKVAN